MRTLVRMLDDPDPRVAVVAANSILDRALGKPKEAPRDQGGGTRLDLSHLSAAELVQFRGLLTKVADVPVDPSPDAPDVADVPQIEGVVIDADEGEADG
jgi:hypothetical protein